MSEHTFHQQIMGEFWDDANQRALKRLADQYHFDTEQYDHMRCTGRTEKGVAMPITMEQRRDIARNAQETMKELGEKALELGFTSKEWTRAVQSAAERLR